MLNVLNVLKLIQKVSTYIRTYTNKDIFHKCQNILRISLVFSSLLLIDWFNSNFLIHFYFEPDTSSI